MTELNTKRKWPFEIREKRNSRSWICSSNFDRYKEWNETGRNTWEGEQRESSKTTSFAIVLIAYRESELDQWLKESKLTDVFKENSFWEFEVRPQPRRGCLASLLSFLALRYRRNHGMPTKHGPNFFTKDSSKSKMHILEDTFFLHRHKLIMHLHSNYEMAKLPLR